MNTNDLADHITEAHSDLTRAKAKSLVEAVLAGVRDAAMKGEEVSLPGFGKFKVQDKPERTARNPRTGESIQMGRS